MSRPTLARTGFLKSAVLRKGLLMIVAAAIILPTIGILPADAAKKGKRSRPDTAPVGSSTSLDGRTLGRTRTCGYDSIQYDGTGAARGPYCH